MNTADIKAQISAQLRSKTFTDFNAVVITAPPNKLAIVNLAASEMMEDFRLRGFKSLVVVPEEEVICVKGEPA